MRLLLLLTTWVLASTPAHAANYTFAYYGKTFGDLSVLAAADQTTYTLGSKTTCAFLAIRAESNVYCYYGNTCVVLSRHPIEMFDVTPTTGIQCYWTDRFCNPPFIYIQDVGCIYVEIENQATFTGAQAACKGPSYLWYPKDTAHATAMRNYINVDRYDVRSGPCGPSVPLPDGQPGPCTPRQGGNFCCMDTEQCGRVPFACDCPTCVNYKVKIKAIWLDFSKVGGQWTYGDGRVETAGFGQLPWGPDDPRTSTVTGPVSDCIAMWFAKGMGVEYHYNVAYDCNALRPFICGWP